MNVFVFGVDVSTRCGPLSNEVFIYFVWQNFERISSKQNAITLIPSNIKSLSAPRGCCVSNTTEQPAMDGKMQPTAIIA